MLALEARAGSPRKVYSEGLSETEAASMADELLEGGTGRVRSRSRWRWSRPVAAMACSPSTSEAGSSPPRRRALSRPTRRLAAAALDAADAMEDARHQANTARVLLELSTSLAEIVGTEEMAAKVARAVPDVIDCDRCRRLPRRRTTGMGDR